MISTLSYLAQGREKLLERPARRLPGHQAHVHAVQREQVALRALASRALHAGGGNRPELLLWGHVRRLTVRKISFCATWPVPLARME